jgi:Zn-dependent protease
MTATARPRSQILISFAGPFAGILLAGFVVSILYALQRIVSFESYWIPVKWKPFESPTLNLFILYLLYVNIVWGLVNLLPIYPLDGGQIARQLFFVVESADRDAAIAAAFGWDGGIDGGVWALEPRYLRGADVWVSAYGNFQAIQFYRNHWR